MICGPASSPTTRRAMGFPLLSSTWSLRWAFSRLPGYCQQDNRSVRGSGELFQMPELLRVKGALLRFFARCNRVTTRPNAAFGNRSIWRGYRAPVGTSCAGQLIWPRYWPIRDIARKPRRCFDRYTTAFSRGSRRRTVIRRGVPKPIGVLSD